ncbi:1-acyl-sn-glycerol-3-phosphate acyltransferase alpha [Diorhabda carinulata]|uniref:1-acyl-sn-glycerol-3-phosphate acyltransferase alpha n=1 Tax=Diorhabda sublineata TaxID=1163346 RepID=UPI0024E0E3A2|nr:1-acyl-sn-glycerol-3-phosphate acyltransferase alpha [Diorhabda sublineata]XP_056632304.1 1-acyl-sn-glycerol-3-phosphate acyltransferase alpha [Diorhabda sublineata]XP_056632305.1 1-acyl-sn-glycerol-3-phosphate acyltransferase alpha [Diorhabda sublineata]XP_056632306.1 1-acyl-sn-glycerol-3-phosphate acyltransferase alpha [Diorhabda sublineata]XP_057662382.1 1-acyl-sn-glycerol-3-phosphate acyltransferase alpha [Diorhabda carinulata]
MSVTYTEILLTSCIFIIPFLYESSHVFRYYLKFFLYYAIVMTNSVILIPAYCFKPGNVRNLLVASDFCGWITTLLGLRWILKGKENLEKDQACIIVANHQSSLDILGMFNFWRVMDKCTVIAKKELLYAGPFGLAAYLCGIIFIPRLQGARAKVIMNEAAKKIKTDKIKLWVYPEGTRRNDGKIHPFKKGAFHMAVTNKLPIVPVVFSRYYFLDRNIKRFDHGKVIVTALPPIDTTDMKIENVEELMENVRNMMQLTFNEASKEVMDGYIAVSNKKIT